MPTPKEKCAEEIARTHILHLALQKGSTCAKESQVAIIRAFVELERCREALTKITFRIDLWKRGVGEGVEIVSVSNECKQLLAEIGK